MFGGFEQAFLGVMGVALLEGEARGGETGEQDREIGHGHRLVLKNLSETRNISLAAIKPVGGPDHVVAGADRMDAQRAAGLVEAHDIGHRHHVAVQAIVSHDTALAEKGFC